MEQILCMLEVESVRNQRERNDVKLIPIEQSNAIRYDLDSNKEVDERRERKLLRILLHTLKVLLICNLLQITDTGMNIYANWNVDVDNELDVDVEDGTKSQSNNLLIYFVAHFSFR